MRRRIALSLTAALVTALAASPALPFHQLGLSAQDTPIVVYLVRHAERADDEPDYRGGETRDPPLSAAGLERAYLLARTLSDAGLTGIHTTDYQRTRQTGQPTAELTGLPLETYDPGDLNAFAGHLAAMPGRHLVLGHSNTTPELVEALGGDPGAPIGAMEYDRLYVVTITPSGTSTVLLRFGNRFAG